VFRLSRLGIPDPRHGARGDLLVHTYVEVPKRLQPSEEQLLRQLAELEHRHVSPRRKSFLDKLREYLKPGE
jgi:molecular chaperone DnaJ